MPKSKYTEDFKKEVAEATLESGMSLAKVGKKFNVHPTLVRNWRIQYTKKDESQETESSTNALTIDDVKNETEIFCKLARDLDDLCNHMKNWFEGDRGEPFFHLLPSGATGTVWQDVEVEDDKFILKSTVYSDEGSDAEFNEEEFISMLKEEWEQEYTQTFDRYGMSIDSFTWTTQVMEE